MIEQMLLGLVAHQVGKKLEYDGANGRVTNSPEANQLPQARVSLRLEARRLGNRIQHPYQGAGRYSTADDELQSQYRFP